MNAEDVNRIANQIREKADGERTPALFIMNFYGNPFVTTLDGLFYLVIEDESGCPSAREISEDFYNAWIAEFAVQGGR